MSPTNEEFIKQDIIDELTWDNSVDASNINVEVKGNTVELNGYVPNHSAKIAAENDVYNLSEITSVINNLKVRPAGTKEKGREDADVASNIINKFEWDNRINAENIRIECSEGVITLRGEVDSFWERNIAESIALFTTGVNNVINEIEVVPLRSAVDIDIKNDIRNAFRRSQFINEKSINVEVDRGIVNLSGTASNYLEKTRAYNIAVFTSGVQDVKDNITIA
ncbi:MAG: BON domain-containing protein [Cyclobacteriaceae bacterium]